MAAAARTGLPPAEDDPLEGGESEEEEEVESGEEGTDDGSEPASLADLYESDAGSDDDEDPSFDPAADGGPEAEAALWSGMARLSISARKGRKGSVAPKMGKEDNDLLAMVDKLMRDGQLKKLKVYECKAYLRMHKLRLSGKKEDLLNRIREHIEVKILGELKYPASSFVLNCKGDACKGDVVVFEQNIYRRKKGDPRGVKSRLCGQRTNAGRIIKESYGTAKQQHTFTVEILWSKGYKPWPPLHPLLIKGRNLYKDKTMRQPWPDEQERSRVLQEKHARGFLARKSREVRIHEKEIGKMRRFNRTNDNTSKGKENMNRISSQKVLPQQKVISMNIVDQRFDERMTPSLQHGQPGNASQQHQISSKQNPANNLLHQQQPYHQHCNEVLPREGATRTSRTEFSTYQVRSIQHVKPEKTIQQQILSRPTPAQQSFKHPTQHNNHRPASAHHMFKHLQDHNNHHQHNKVLPQEDTTRTFSILGQAPCLKHGGLGNAMPLEKILKPTPIEQIRNQPQPIKHQHQNAVLLQKGAKKETYRVDSIDNRNYHRTESGKAPCIQHMGAVNARQQNIPSKPTLPQLTTNPPRSPKHGNTHQHGYNGHQHGQVDHQWHHPLRPSNKNFCSTNLVEDYGYQGQMTQEQYHPQVRRHQNHQTQKIHHQNRHDSRRMNHNQYHPQENYHQNYWYSQQFPPLKPCSQQFPPLKPCAQQFPPLKPCHYYQRGLWCPYEENCKFSHDN
ncbi:zinc finger CCCH domain-containing protein 62-like [Lolium rigidum]|uniref:zinc finger CCCH domain-containing protein 62-like n=1 Tax=Lolium rigidum TaxID=89674 RepID=UPI001F5D0802|nr:zinc finger CCCH domain-containing protein 62-like [Lolium rigidum]